MDDMDPPLDRKEMKALMKEAYKEAQKEWMDAKLQEVGKWSLRTIAVFAIGALVFFILWANGWKAPGP